MKFFRARKSAYRTAVRRLDEAIYTPYTYELSKSNVQVTSEAPSTRDPTNHPEITVSHLDVSESGENGDLAPPADIPSPQIKQKPSRFHNQQAEGESDVFLFEYGVTAIYRPSWPFLYFWIVDCRDVGDDGSTRKTILIFHVGFHIRSCAFDSLVIFTSRKTKV